MTLKFFEVDSSLTQRVCDVEFYQMPLTRLVEQTLKSDLEFSDYTERLPSWTKLAASPPKAKGFWTSMLRNVILGEGNFPELNFSEQSCDYAKYESGKKFDSRRIVMMFLPGSIRLDCLRLLADYAMESIGTGFEVVTICGDTTTNGEAERFVNDEILKTSKNLLILSRGMASRSFSIPEITELYLAYDGGDNGATIQKLSRALTPYRDGRYKVGRIISLSFDPNRDDVFDAMIIVTAANYAKNYKKKSLKESFRDVIQTIDIFRCTESGSVRFDADELLSAAIARKSVERVIGKTSNFSFLDPDDIRRLAMGDKAYSKLPKTDVTDHGKTRPKKDSVPKTPSEKPLTEKQIEDARKALVVIVENVDILIFGTKPCSSSTADWTLDRAFEILDSDFEMQQAVKEEFGLEYEFVRRLFTCGAINSQMTQLLFDRT